jgi:hypothetical protein
LQQEVARAGVLSPLLDKQCQSGFPVGRNEIRQNIRHRRIVIGLLAFAEIPMSFNAIEHHKALGILIEHSRKSAGEELAQDGLLPELSVKPGM